MDRCPRCGCPVVTLTLSESGYFCSRCGFKVTSAEIIIQDDFVIKKEEDQTSLIHYFGTAKHVKVPTGVQIIKKGAFYGNENVESVDVGEDVLKIEECVFESKKLKKIRIGKNTKCDFFMMGGCPNFEGFYFDMSLEDWYSFVSSQGGPRFFPDENGDHDFDGKKYSEIKHIVVPDQSKKLHARCFGWFSGLESVEFPEVYEEIPNALFWACKKLKSVKMPSVCKIINRGAFFKCEALESINFPEGLSEIGGFCGCSNLKSLRFPEGLSKIESTAFSECTGLESIAFPKGLSTIEDGAFSKCKRLETVCLPEGLSKIEEDTFAGCESLKTVSIPSTIKRIHKLAFDDCENIETVYYNGTESQWKIVNNKSKEIANAKIVFQKNG